MFDEKLLALVAAGFSLHRHRLESLCYRIWWLIIKGEKIGKT
jgi:hypothetical protein